MRQYNLEVYCNKDLHAPFIEWLESFSDKSISAAISKRIKRMEYGNFGDWKDVGLGVKELRLHFGAGYRVYFGMHANFIIIILLGGSKATQKRDIKTAYKFLQEYKNANN